jgi:hypothetical protein
MVWVGVLTVDAVQVIDFKAFGDKPARGRATALYIGNKNDARNEAGLHERGITHILNCTPPRRSVGGGLGNRGRSRWRGQRKEEGGGAGKTSDRRGRVHDKALYPLVALLSFLLPVFSLDPESGCPNFFEVSHRSWVYKRIPIFDNRGEDILSFMPGAVAFIEQAKHYGSVLVGLRAGREGGKEGGQGGGRPPGGGETHPPPSLHSFLRYTATKA